MCWVSFLNPTYGLHAACARHRSLYYSIMAENAGLVDILPEIGFLVGMGVIYFVIAV
jgi:hypothetical protein